MGTPETDMSELSRPEIQAVLTRLIAGLYRPGMDHALVASAIRKLQEQLLKP